MTRALVTGASGFIGYHLVTRLCQAGHQVTCLVRETSNVDRLRPFGVRLAYGDVLDRTSLRQAVAQQDLVFHLAGVTKSITPGRLTVVNAQGTRNVATVCAEFCPSPTLVIVSSLAAIGPSVDDVPLRETHPPAPVSDYGRSKLQGEQAARACADRVPMSIVRPPIVLGPGDRDGFELFAGIAKWRVHLVPSWQDYRVSVIAGADLAQALLVVAERGQRLVPQENLDQGVYHISADQMPTYADLGHLIAQSLGSPRPAIVRVPGPAVMLVGGFNEALARLRGRPHILNRDKAREATAGAWICDNRKLRAELNFAPGQSLQERLAETGQWYADHGWLKR